MSRQILHMTGPALHMTGPAHAPHLGEFLCHLQAANPVLQLLCEDEPTR